MLERLTKKFMEIKVAFGSVFKEKDRIEASILAVFSTAIYLIDNNNHIYVIHNINNGKLYFGVGVFDFLSFARRHHFTEGQKAVYENGVMTIDNFVFVEKKYSFTSKASSAASLEEELAKYGKGELIRFFKGDRIDSYFKAKYDDFKNQLIEKNQIILSKSLESLVGYGKGLTPDFDDYLVGLLYTFARLDKERFLVLSTAVLDNLKNTSLISQEYLLSAINNKEFELVNLVISDSPHKEECEKLMSIGNSSGTNILLGVLHAKRMVKQYGI